VVPQYLLNRENRSNVLPRSTDIIQVVKESPTDTIHIKVQQDAMPYTRRQQEKHFNRFVTQPDFGGVPLKSFCFCLVSLS